MNAIVTAGGAIQPGEPLYKLYSGGLKAMIEVAGKPMVQWVLDALGQSELVERVIVVGLPPETALDCAKPMILIPDHGGMLENVQAGAREIQQLDPQATHAVLSSGDIPTVRSEIVDWLGCQCEDLEQDLYFSVVERSTLEVQFPGARRTSMKLKDVELCSGELHCFRLQAATGDSTLWNRLIVSRKSRYRQASLMGYDTVLLLMLRQLNLRDAEATVAKRLGIRARAVLSPYAEIAMDIDRPSQLEIIRDHFSKRPDKYAAGTE